MVWQIQRMDIPFHKTLALLRGRRLLDLEAILHNSVTVTRKRLMHLDSTIIEEPFMQSIPFKNNLTIMVPSRYIYPFAASLSWTWSLLHNMVYMSNVSFSQPMRSPCAKGTNLYVCSNMLALTVGSTILVPSHASRILSSWGSSSENIKKGHLHH